RFFPIRPHPTGDNVMEQQTSLAHRWLESFPGFQTLKRVHRSLKRLGATDMHWVRVVMNRATTRMIQSLAPENLSALEISGDHWRKRAPFRSYRSVRYPDFDICQSTLEESFDLIIAEQVFEHLLWPYRAGKNVYKMLNPGGSFLVTTPFLIRVHRAP